MKKLVLFAALGICFGAASASARDSTGCGLGSMIFAGQKGIVPQTLAVTTNGTYGNQTFAISTGTSGCDPNGTIEGGRGRRAALFLINNLEQYAFDASRGEGETIKTIAGILGVEEAKVAEVSKTNFDRLFPDYNTDALFVTENLLAMLDVKA